MINLKSPKIYPYLILSATVAILAIGLIIGITGRTVGKIRQRSAPSNPPEFIWGVQTQADALGRVHPSIWNQQLVLAEDLGADWVKMSYNPAFSESLATHQSLFESAWDHGLNVALVIQPENSDKLTYDEGFNYTKSIASAFKGEIGFYELDLTNNNVLKNPNTTGEGLWEYDKDKFEALKNWLSGAIKAINQNDPQAQVFLLLDNQKIGLVNLLIKDGVKFDGIDWIWSSKNKPIDKTWLTDNRTVFDAITAFEKPVILTYKNDSNDQLAGAEQEAKMIQTTDFSFKNRDKIRGFFSLSLIDTPYTGEKSFYGLVSAQKQPSGTYLPGAKRPIFEVLKAKISSLNSTNN